MLWLVALLLTPLMAEPVRAAGCPTGGTISDAQRQSLRHLPPGLRTVLQAVRAQNRRSCEAPQGDGPVDPWSLPPVPARSPDTVRPPATDRAVPDEVVAVIRGDAASVSAIAARHNLTIRSQHRSALLEGFLVRFGINDNRPPAVVTAALLANETVDTPGPNHIYRLQDEPRAPSSRTAPVAKSSVYESARFALRNMGLSGAGLSLSGQNIRVGVIDTAVDLRHPDLKDAIADSFDALPDLPVSNRRHGTAVAGLILGRSMIKGVAPRAKLLIARAFDDNGEQPRKASSTSYRLLQSLDWAIRKGARIVNMSFTGPRNPLMSKALTLAARKNILLIAAAGNGGPDAPAAFPAAEQSVLAVTATDIDNRIYANANAGRYVFVSAPGVDVLAAAPDRGVDLVSGTSFAAPFLSGLAALMLEQNGSLTPRQFAKRVERTARDLGSPGRDETYGVGLARLDKALRQ